jgi:hypothetical protein
MRGLISKRNIEKSMKVEKVKASGESRESVRVKAGEESRKVKASMESKK